MDYACDIIFPGWIHTPRLMRSTLLKSVVEVFPASPGFVERYFRESFTFLMVSKGGTLFFLKRFLTLLPSGFHLRVAKP